MDATELTRLRRRLRNEMALGIASCMSRIEGLYRGFGDARAEDMNDQRKKLMGPLKEVWVAEQAMGEEDGTSDVADSKETG